MEHLEYMEQQAARNMEFHLHNMDCLSSEANSTLNLLYLLIGASFMGVVGLYNPDKPTGLAFSLAILCVWLTGLSVYLAFACLHIRNAEAPANEPGNLKLRKGYSSEQIRQFELENLQVRIERNRKRNERTARHLNWTRFLICASPILFAVCLGLIHRLASVPLFK